MILKEQSMYVFVDWEFENNGTCLQSGCVYGVNSTKPVMEQKTIYYY